MKTKIFLKLKTIDFFVIHTDLIYCIENRKCFQNVLCTAISHFMFQNIFYPNVFLSFKMYLRSKKYIKSAYLFTVIFNFK